MKPTRAATGMFAEEACLQRLREEGCSIVAHRYRNPAHEIDIVAQFQNVLLFIEVKARPSLEAGLEVLAELRPDRYATAVEIFLSHHPQYVHCDIRFDGMIVTPNGNIHRIENVWGA